MIYQSRNNQTVFDVVLQTYGDINLMYKLIQDSDFDNVLSYPLPLTSFNFDPKLISDNVVANFLNQNGLVIVTGDSNRSQQVPPNYLETDDGIGLQTDDGTQMEVD